MLTLEMVYTWSLASAALNPLLCLSWGLIHNVLKTNLTWLPYFYARVPPIPCKNTR
ncbi:hypothetical protein HMI56_005478 [Coelomomyces lativittatus]|nr:hypothetical protein HMI56_005478 [Coelomomyces lativittatus]